MFVEFFIKEFTTTTIFVFHTNSWIWEKWDSHWLTYFHWMMQLANKKSQDSDPWLLKSCISNNYTEGKKVIPG